MTEAGAPPEAIAIAIDAIEVATASAAAEIEGRRSNDRQRKQRSRDRHRTVLGQSVTPPLPDKEKSPTPPKEINPTPTSLRSVPPTPPATPREFLLECLSAESADAVLAHRRAKRCPLTARAAQLLAKGFMSTGDPNAAADMMIERGWQGFKVEWFDNERAGNGQRTTNGRGSIVEAGRKLTERLVAERLDRERAGVRGEDGDPPVRLLPAFGGQRP